MNDTRKAKKGSKQHIHVFTRVRPLNEAEHAGSSFTVVQTPSNREVIVNDRSHEKYAKKFTFDRVFGPESKQIDVYNVVAKPLVEQVLAGYNCTVFAYGQTGTGKTFTMEGVTDDPSKHWETDNNAGLIPRAVAHLFDELCVLQVQEYVVRVSFLEIYNEELIDLLSSTYDTSKIRLYEDPNKKGSVIVHGLEEMIVRSKAEVYSILHKGSEKRQTAATLMNANSSRSHTVFSITVHIKENSVDGEEVLKLGKINLVDLAGSENVTRSGSSDKRAREAGNINQSLLTLGRVIIALVERAPHIPYRESKLTRLLQESLGGRMKTSIVATISPASVNLEETLSTLDYAHRAKNITNRPEINQKLFKKTLLLEYTEEIVRLKKDLQATRERIGVYLAQENYTQMQNLMQYQSKEMEAKVNRIKELQAEVEKTEQILDELRRKQAEQFAEVEKRNAELEAIVSAVNSKYSRIQTVKQEKIEQEYLLEKHSATEQVLVSQAEQLLTVVDTTVTDISRLRDKISRKKEIEQKNAEACHRFKNNFAENGECVHVGVSDGIEDFKRFSESIENDIREQTHSYIDGTNQGIEYISKALVQSHEEGINVLYSTINSTHAHCQKWVEEQEKNLSNLTEKEQELLRAIAIKLAAQLQELMQSEVKIRLQTLTESVLKDYSVVMDFIMNAINSTLNYHSEDRERAINFFEEMKQMVDRVMGCERKTAEKHEAFAKMINNTINYFNNLHTESKECDFTACKNLENISEISDGAQERGASVHNFNIETDTGLRNRMVEDIGSAKNHTLNELEKCQTLGDTRTTIMDKLQRDVAEFSESLQSNASSVEDSMRRFREKLEENSNTLTKSITDTREIVRNMAVDHSNIVQTHQTESLEKSEDIISEFRKKCSDATNTTNEINGRLSILLDGVNRFFTEDLQHDVPTGCTPIKKNYSYPREFPALPPKGKGH